MGDGGALASLWVWGQLAGLLDLSLRCVHAVLRDWRYVSQGVSISVMAPGSALPRPADAGEDPEMASQVTLGAVSPSCPLTPTSHISAHLFASKPASWGRVQN